MPKTIKQPFKAKDIAVFSEKLDLMIAEALTVAAKMEFTFELSTLRTKSSRIEAGKSGDISVATGQEKQKSG